MLSLPSLGLGTVVDPWQRKRTILHQTTGFEKANFLGADRRPALLSLLRFLSPVGNPLDITGLVDERQRNVAGCQ